MLHKRLIDSLLFEVIVAEVCTMFSFYIFSASTEASVNTLVSESSVSPKTYIRKKNSGWTYNFKMNGKNIDFGSKVHYLKNYPNTTWEVTRKMYVKKNLKNYLYYYITNKSGTTHGWIWHDYLTPGVAYATVWGIAKKQLGKPYVYGATGPMAFDCSGLTQYIYKRAADKTIQRTAQAQYNSSKHVRSDDIQKGDLAFFGSNSVNISHVGMYIGNGKMIDAQNYGVITENINAPWWNLVGYAKPENLSE